VGWCGGCLNVGASQSRTRNILGASYMGPAYNRQGTSPEKCLLSLGNGKGRRYRLVKALPGSGRKSD